LYKFSIKRDTTNNILVWITILITAKGNIITISNVTLTLVMLIIFLIFYHRKLKFDKGFVYFTIIYFLIVIIYITKFGYMDLRGVREYIKLLYAYMFIKLLYKDFLQKYTNIIYILALISLPLYALQLLDYQMMKSIIGIIEHNISFLDYRDSWYENIFFFTLNDHGMYRNSGFAWEPKGYGTFLTLALFFQLFLNNFKIDKKIFVYFLAIITTWSTATYSIFLLIVLFYLYNKRSVSLHLTAFIIMIPLLVFTFLKVDFLKDKIIYEYDTKEKFVNYVNDRNYKGESRSLGRFGSFIVDYNDFIKEPLFGYGLYSEKRTMYSINGVKLVRVNGFSDYLAKFGILGMLFLLILLFLTFKKLSRQFNFRGYFLIIIGILATSFASAILLTPLYLGLVFYFFIKNQSQGKI
jgi:hypothetical protein